MPDDLLHPGMRCPHCRTGQPVHLYRVTARVQMLACEPCAQRSGLERDDIDEAGEAPDAPPPHPS